MWVEGGNASFTNILSHNLTSLVALEGRHMARRARYLGESDSLIPFENSYEESRWRRARLTQIAYLHSPNTLEVSELSTVESTSGAVCTFPQFNTLDYLDSVLRTSR